MTDQDFQEDPRPERPGASDSLLLDLDGFEGPIDLLLQLARDQKVDITRISILALAEQYLEFVRKARRLRIELAADYLVMAAWLAYLKSRLLLPEPEPDEDSPSAAEMAAALKFQLQRLEAMQEAGRRLLARPRLGEDFFARGEPVAPPEVTRVVYDVSLYDLLRAYGTIRGRQAAVGGLRIVSLDLYSVEDAMRRLSSLLGEMPGWRSLQAFLPPELGDDLRMRSAMASTLLASLEMCRDGKLDLRQDSTFGPVYVRARPDRATDEPA